MWQLKNICFSSYLHNASLDISYSLTRLINFTAIINSTFNPFMYALLCERFKIRIAQLLHIQLKNKRRGRMAKRRQHTSSISSADQLFLESESGNDGIALREFRRSF